MTELSKSLELSKWQGTQTSFKLN